MDEESPAVPRSGINGDAVRWRTTYDTPGATYWYRTVPHPMLVKHYEKLNPGDTARNIFVPLCGMSVDLEWYSDDKKIPMVVGLDFVLKVLEKVKDRSEHSWAETDVPGLGPGSKLLTRSDGKMKLYCADILDFTQEFEGRFEAMYDRGAIFILPRKDVKRYVKVLKDLLLPGGRLLLETFEFDEKTVDPAKDVKMYPPYPMYHGEIKSLFEPECSVEVIDRMAAPSNWGGFTDAAYQYYLIVKK